MKHNKPPPPLHLLLLSANAVMLDPNAISQLVEQFRWLRKRGVFVVHFGVLCLPKIIHCPELKGVFVLLYTVFIFGYAPLQVHITR